MINVGIDPGRWGAIVAYINGAPVNAWPMENKTVKLKNGRSRFELDVQWMKEVLKSIYNASPGCSSGLSVHIEELTGSTQGKGAFRFGLNYGMIRGALMAMCPGIIHEIKYVPVNAWKKYFGLTQKRRPAGAPKITGPEKKAMKQLSINKVKELWPWFYGAYIDGQSFDKKSGMCDAALIVASQF